MTEMQNPDGTDKSIEQLWLEECRDRGITPQEMLEELRDELQDAVEGRGEYANTPQDLRDEDVLFYTDSVETMERMLHS